MDIPSGPISLWDKPVYTWVEEGISRQPVDAGCSSTHRWVSQATAHEDSQLWGDRKGRGPGNRVGDDQVGFGGMQRAGARDGSGAHLLSQQHGPLRELVGVGTGLLPHRDLLGQKVFALEKGGGDQRRSRDSSSLRSATFSLGPSSETIP